MAKVISFMSQKGGTGKTTLSILSATRLHNMGAGVAVIDCDFPQHSFKKTRSKDVLDLMERKNKKSDNKLTIEEIESNLYPIIPASVKEAIVAIKSLKTSSQLEFIFIDIPGTFNVEGMDTLIDSLDLVVVPVELEFKSITAAMETLAIVGEINKNVVTSVLWTKINTNHKIAERKAYEDYFRSTLNPYVFKYMLMDTVTVSRLLNTITAQPKSINGFVDEVTILLSDKPISHSKAN